MGRRSALSLAERATEQQGAFVTDSVLMAPSLTTRAERLTCRGRPARTVTADFNVSAPGPDRRGREGLSGGVTGGGE